MLSTAWEQRGSAYDFVIIGSGYGGAITAARLASADLHPKPSVCILERGREWQPGEFPETLPGVVSAARGDLNSLGLYELLNHPEISVIKGSGLGGTSLINANVAILPDREVFEQLDWPAAVTYDALLPFYREARKVLAANPHPRASELAKVRALDRRAREIGTAVQPLDIAVNFTIDGANAWGAAQKPCIDCGNCVTGCNVGAKNTLCMNYLPMARNAGATILTQAKVEWLEKLADGRWRIHGKHVAENFASRSFTMDAGEVVLAAGSLNSTEILLRSEAHGLSVSPALGTRFGGNGDFFGLAYNGDYQTDVLGYRPGESPRAPDSPPPGPNIVGLLRYNGALPEMRRISIEDFSFPSAYIAGSKAVFAALGGVDTVAGNEDAQRARLVRDLDPLAPAHAADGAMNHTMLYLVMGIDNARGTILFEAPFTEPDGRIRISWDQAGQQEVFTRMNGELRRHARALRASFISNPTWSVFRIGHLITAHPLGGCPMGEDCLQGAVDPWGRVFAGDGSVHKGLSVADGSVVPSALGVNPFLTISALTERFAERRIRALAGEAYPPPPLAVSMAGIDALDAIEYEEARLEALFRRSPTLGIGAMLNAGGEPHIDTARQTVRNDRYWKGFFPKGHVLNAMSAAIFTGFKKEFHLQADGRYVGVTSDADGRIRARNSLEEIAVDHSGGGTLEAGRYILLRYLDAPWQGFYDVFKVINEDLLIGRVYLGAYPHGTRLFTFAMSRRYGFSHMTVDDHAVLYAAGAAPTPDALDGAWRMDCISNANQAGGVAYLKFGNLPDGRFTAQYQLMGLMEGMVTPAFLRDHFQLTDFTPFHDEIRTVTPDLLVGKYVTAVPGAAAMAGDGSLGLLHVEEGGRVGFYYLLTRASGNRMPANTLLGPYLDLRLPDGVGMTFDEEMTGWYFPGLFTPAPGRDGDLAIAARIPDSGRPAGAVACSFAVRIAVADVNEFVDGYEHEAQLSGSIRFDQFDGLAPATFAIDPSSSRFHYLRINPATGEAQMVYHLEFPTHTRRRFVLEGVKYMQKDETGPVKSIREILSDYTTLYCHVRECLADGSPNETGTGYLKFRTFEDAAAVGSLAAFLASFRVTGTSDPRVQLQARLRFLAFTAQFVQREYDPLGFPSASAAGR